MRGPSHSDIKFHHRIATKKSGPTINSFLKKIQQQMGVAIVGFAAYRDANGKLCTFECVCPPPSQILFLRLKTNFHSFCTEDPRKPSFPQAHTEDIDKFLKKWGNWVSQNGKANPYLLHLLILASGMGSTKSNETSEDEEPEDLARDDWVQLLNEKNGVYSLKPWDEVMEMKANKTTIAHACREIMRQAWSE